MVRFRVDRALKAHAEQLCASLGMELNDVLRILVRRIAMEGAIPFDLNRPNQSPSDARAPFDRYGPFLQEDLAHLKAESVLTLLATFAANRARRIAVERRQAKPNQNKIDQLRREATEAMHLRRSLDVKDDALLALVEKRFTTLLAAD